MEYIKRIGLICGVLLCLTMVMGQGDCSAEDGLQVEVEVEDNGRPATVTVSWRQDQPVDLRAEWRYDSTAPWIPSTDWRSGRDFSRTYNREGRFSFRTQGQECWNTDTLTVRLQIDPQGDAAPLAAVEKPIIIAVPFGTLERAFDGHNSGVIRLGGPGNWRMRSGSQDIYKGKGDYWKYAQHDLIMVSWYQLVHSGQRDSAFPGFVDSVRAINPDAIVFGFDNQFTFHPDPKHAVYGYGNAYPGAKMQLLRPFAVRNAEGVPVVSPFKTWTSNMLEAECRAAYATVVGWAWNHTTNRRPGVGLMIDVMEPTWNFDDIDADGNGIDDRHDPGERRQRMIAWLDVIDRVREATGGEMMIGGNSSLALRWDTLSTKLDFIFVENIPKPTWGKYGTRYANMLDPDFTHAGLDYFGTGPDVRPLMVYPPEILSRMRSDNYGPLLVIEPNWSAPSRYNKPYYVDIYGLFFDEVYPLWTSTRRKFDHPQFGVGLPAVNLGAARSGIVTTGDGAHYRQYERGFVKLWLAAPPSDITPFRYVVVDTVAGDTLRARLGAAIASCSKAAWQAARPITIRGEGFGAAQGRGFVRVADTADFRGSVKQQPVTSWSDTEIVFSLATAASWRNRGPLWVRVVTDKGEVAQDGWYDYKATR